MRILRNALYLAIYWSQRNEILYEYYSPFIYALMLCSRLRSFSRAHGGPCAYVFRRNDEVYGGSR